MVTHFMRDTFIGLGLYYASGRRLLQHQEEKPGFEVPERYRLSKSITNGEKAKREKPNPISSDEGGGRRTSSEETVVAPDDEGEQGEDPNLVEW